MMEGWSGQFGTAVADVRQAGVEYPLRLITILWNNPAQWPKPWAGTPGSSPVPIMATTSPEEVKQPKNIFLENTVAGTWSYTALKLSNCHITFGVIAQESTLSSIYHFLSILPCTFSISIIGLDIIYFIIITRHVVEYTHTHTQSVKQQQEKLLLTTEALKKNTTKTRTQEELKNRDTCWQP